MKKYILIALLLQVFVVGKAQHSFVSELNQKVFSSDSVRYPYKVIFAGHLYGGQNEEVKPYATFSNSFNKINNEKAVLFFSLGDAVRHSDMENFDVFSDLSLKIDAPVFPALGNHEWKDSITAQMYMGFPYYIIESPGSAFIVLNSENWSNKEQKAFLDKRLDEYINNPSVENIFILSHRLIWAIGNPDFADLVKLTNSKSMHTDEQPWVDQSKMKLNSDKNFYFVSGDLGLEQKLPFFYQKEGNITYIATGLGDLPTDAAIEATINKDNEVTFSALYLGTDETAKLDSFNMEKVAGLSKKTETITAAVQLNNSASTKAFVLVLTLAAFSVALFLLFGKNEV